MTALEQSGYSQLTSSSQIRGFLTELSSKSATAEKVTIATSALGNPIDALLISSEMHRFKNGFPTASHKMTLMLVGSQHGMEPSGAEALLILSREIVNGSLTEYLKDMNFILIPNSNPDGRDLNRRVNGNGVNLSTNFNVLSEPESRGIMDVFYRWRPEVVLDVHESAVLKKKSLAMQGFLIDFEAQFEAGNNPNIDSRIRTLSFERLLPDVIARVNAQGLPAQHYVGEITDVHQAITHGGLSLKNLRNVAGMLGAFSFLLENRLDPSTGSYATPRNIRVRVAKQYLCMTSFMQCCRTYRADIIRLSRNACMRWANNQGEDPLYPCCTYVSGQGQPQITLPLRKLESGQVVKKSFDYHGAVDCQAHLTLPSAYIITAHHTVMRDFLDRHHIEYEVANEPMDLSVEIQYVAHRKDSPDNVRSTCDVYTLSTRNETYTLGQGDLIISLSQAARRLIPLLLELESMSSIFRSDSYSHFVEEQRDFFVYSVPETLRYTSGEDRSGTSRPTEFGAISRTKVKLPGWPSITAARNRPIEKLL